MCARAAENEAFWCAHSSWFVVSARARCFLQKDQAEGLHATGQISEKGRMMLMNAGKIRLQQ